MYDPEITSNYLSKLNPSILLNAGTPKEKELFFQLEYHSVEETRQMADHLDTIINKDLYESTCETNNVKLELKRKLDEDELIWIENERILCKWDCNYFMDHYYKVLSGEGKGWIQFAPLVPQIVNRRIRARLQAAGRPINKWTVKARQQGETVDSEGVILQRLNYFTDTISLIASMDSKESGKMAEKFTKAHAKLPWWNRTFLTGLTAGEEYNFDNGSGLDIGYGTQEKLGRGRTVLISHLSEIPFYKHPEKALEDSLFHGMHENPWQIILGEGTAEVIGDYYHKKTMEIKEGMEDGTSSFILCFHPWCARRDLFPTETWIHTRNEAFAKWTPSIETIQHANKLRNWVKANEDYREVFKDIYGTYDWQLDREQMFYYEIEKRDAVRRNRLHAFLKEKPSDLEEAFQNAGDPLYPIQTVITISDRAQAKVPDVYKLKGDPNEISPTLFPQIDEIDYDKEIIDIQARWIDHLPSFHYQLIPIKFNGWQNFNPQNKILIWEHPKSNATYGMSCDDSDGLGVTQSDDAVFEIFKKGTVEYADKQVLEFASAELPPMNLRPFGLALATYFSPDEQLLLVPETNKSKEFLNAMINVGWQNIFKRIPMDRQDKDLIISNLLGFHTSRGNRDDIISHFNALVIGDFVELYSMELIQELKGLVKKRTTSAILGEKHEKIMAARNKSDNRFMAAVILMYALHRNEIIGLERAAWQQRIKNENSIVVLKSASPSILDRLDLDKASEFGYNDDEAEYDIDNLIDEIDNFAYDF